MNLQEGIEKLKELLFKDENKTVALKFKEELLNDGTTMIQYDAEELAVGVIVNVLDSNGVPLPLPLGDYVTADGDTFSVVDDMGAIDNVVLVPEAEEGAPVAPAKDATVEQTATPVAPAPAPKRVIKSQVEEHVFHLEIEGFEPIAVDFSSMFAKLETENKELKEQLTKAENFSKEIANVVEQIADEPAKEATEKINFSVKDFRKEFKNDLHKFYK